MYDGICYCRAWSTCEHYADKTLMVDLETCFAGCACACVTSPLATCCDGALTPSWRARPAQIVHVIETNVGVCRWVGLAVLLVQVACMGLAYALSSAQQRLLLDASMCGPGRVGCVR